MGWDSVGAGTTDTNSALNGRLDFFGVASLLTILEMEERDGYLMLQSEDAEQTAYLHLRGGQVVRARLDSNPFLPDEQVIFCVLDWTGGSFTFSARPIEDQDEVRSSTRFLLLEAARRKDEDTRTLDE